MRASDSRYPFTYAADYIRQIAGHTKGGTKLSRADACNIIQQIAKTLGQGYEQTAQKLADKQLAKTDVDLARETRLAMEQMQLAVPEQMEFNFPDANCS